MSKYVVPTDDINVSIGIPYFIVDYFDFIYVNKNEFNPY